MTSSNLFDPIQYIEDCETHFPLNSTTPNAFPAIEWYENLPHEEIKKLYGMDFKKHCGEIQIDQAKQNPSARFVWVGIMSIMCSLLADVIRNSLDKIE
jgi:hypothetical protein